VWRVPQLYKEPKVPGIWEGLLAPGSITLFHSPPKMGKSYTVFGLIGALQRGHAFLGRNTQATGTVFLTEEGRSTLREKADEFQLLGDSRLWILSRREPLLARMPLLEALNWGAELAKENQCKLLVLDTLSAWSGLRCEEENHAAKVEQIFTDLKTQAAASGVALLVLHHTQKKGKTARGSTALEGAADAVMRLACPDEGSNRRVLFSKGRLHDMPGRIEFTHGKETGFTVVDEGSAREAVLKVLPEKSPGMTQAELVLATRISKRTIIPMLMELQKSGAIRFYGEGTKSTPYRYLKNEVKQLSPSTNPGTSPNP
jgi:predicted ATP-dependent serine protease